MQLIEIVARNLRYYRDKHNLSQEELAEASGVTKTLICWLEGKKRKNVTLHTLERLASALHIKTIDLLQ